MNAIILSDASASFSALKPPANFSDIGRRNFGVGFFPNLRSRLDVVKGWRAVLSKYVRPTPTSYGVRGSRFANFVSFGNRFYCVATAEISAHGNDEALVEDTVRVDLPRHRRSYITALGNHVEDIIAVRSNPKMVGIDAFGVVAFMQDKKPFWYAALMMHIAKAMRQLFMLITKIPGISHAISLVIQRPSPLPASIESGFVNSFPEAIVKHMATMAFPHQYVNRRGI